MSGLTASQDCGAQFPERPIEKLPLMLGLQQSRALYWWYDPKAGYNFGDWIGPYLFRKLTGRAPIKFLPGKGPMPHTTFTVGSILHIIQRPGTTTVWGSGTINTTLKVAEPKRILAVRGPKTQAFLAEQGYDCPEVYGDPGVLLPLVFKPEGETVSGLTILPHFQDTEQAQSYFGNRAGVRFLSVQDDVETVAAGIAASEAFVTSSLHGLILAHAYDVPVLWVSFDGAKDKDVHKYHDYFLSVGITDLPERVVLTGSETTEGVIKMAQAAPKADQRAARQSLARTCPFPLNAAGRKALAEAGS